MNRRANEDLRTATQPNTITLGPVIVNFVDYLWRLVHRLCEGNTESSKSPLIGTEIWL